LSFLLQLLTIHAHRPQKNRGAPKEFRELEPYATPGLVDTIKGQRTRELKGLQMSWRCHGDVMVQIACVRKQELKKGEGTAQIAVRFLTDQVRSFSIG